MKRKNVRTVAISRTKNNLTLSMNDRLYTCIKSRAIREIESGKNDAKEAKSDMNARNVALVD